MSDAALQAIERCARVSGRDRIRMCWLAPPAYCCGRASRHCRLLRLRKRHCCRYSAADKPSSGKVLVRGATFIRWASMTGACCATIARVRDSSTICLPGIFSAGDGHALLWRADSGRRSAPQGARDSRAGGDWPRLTHRPHPACPVASVSVPPWRARWSRSRPWCWPMATGIWMASMRTVFALDLELNASGRRAWWFVTHDRASRRA